VARQLQICGRIYQVYARGNVSWIFTNSEACKRAKRTHTHNAHSDVRTGRGIYTWTSGETYEGEVRIPIILLIYIISSKIYYINILYTLVHMKYEPQFVNGVIHGQGYFLSADQSWSIEGHFARGSPTRGTLTEPDDSDKAAPGNGKIFNVQFDKKKGEAYPDLPIVGKASSRFEILDKSSLPNRRPLPGEPEPPPPKKLPGA
jgi:hypothetical protein